MDGKKLRPIDFKQYNKVADSMPYSFAMLAQCWPSAFGVWRFKDAPGPKNAVQGWYIFPQEWGRIGISTVEGILWVDAEDLRNGLIVAANALYEKVHPLGVL
jgi:hypothetical protein